MTSPITVYKLMILYLLDRAEGRIAMDRLSSFLIESGYAGFLSLVSSYAELEQSGLASSEAEGDQVFLKITWDGKEALRCFAGDLGEDIRRHCDRWLKENELAVREEQYVTGSFSYAGEDRYEVRLQIREDMKPLLEISLRVPDKATAAKITENWKRENPEIYRFLVEKLF